MGLQGVGVPWWVTSAVSSYGSQAEQAFQEGATATEANISSAISAGAEVLSEKIFGGFEFQGKALSDGVSDIISRGVSNKLLKGLMKFGLDAGGEGIEEVFSSVASRFGQWLTYQDDKTIRDMLFSEEAFDEYLESAIGGGLLGGGNTALNIASNAKAGRDPVSGLNATEEQVVRDLFDSRVADAESDGKKLSELEKNTIWDEVVEQMDRGEISIDDIERILGGETYKTYQDTVSKHDAIWNEFDTLQSMRRGDMTGKQVEREAELKKIIEEDLAKSPAREELGKKLRDEVYSTAKNSRLIESYNERVKRGQAFEADVSKYTEAERKIIQKAIDSGKFNNARKTHEFVDFVAKLGASRGIDFDFMDSKLEVKTANGETRYFNAYKKGNTIGFNIKYNKFICSI
jgi:predicted DNA binding protein